MAVRARSNFPAWCS